jgi:signal transduction histidine kinase
MFNLARNAIEAMAEVPVDRRRLTLQTRRPNQEVEIRVSDTGPGLDTEVADRIFEPFVTTKTQGLGLGLSISSGIVAAHGGQLTVDSVSGEGATFSFKLPLAEGGDLNGS